MAYLLSKRQNTYDDHADPYWGYSPAAEAAKWSIVGAIVLIFFLWFVGGYYHAQRRVRRGQRPLAYHMFLLPRSQREPFMEHYPHHQEFGHGYPMQAYPAPPPAYNAEHSAPPQYQPPEGGSKVNPDQDWVAPPPGPPPGQETSIAESSNASQNASGSAVPPVLPISSTATTESPPKPSKKAGIRTRMNPFK